MCLLNRCCVCCLFLQLLCLIRALCHRVVFVFSVCVFVWLIGCLACNLIACSFVFNYCFCLVCFYF